MKFRNSLIALSLLQILSFPTVSQALQLKDLHTMQETDQAWYLGGVYDSNLSGWNDKGVASNCLEKMQFKGFVEIFSNFIKNLPEDPDSDERRLYDKMNAAAVAWLVIQKECT